MTDLDAARESAWREFCIAQGLPTQRDYIRSSMFRAGWDARGQHEATGRESRDAEVARLVAMHEDCDGCGLIDELRALVAAPFTEEPS